MTLPFYLYIFADHIKVHYLPKWHYHIQCGIFTLWLPLWQTLCSSYNACFCNDPHLLIWNMTPALICYFLRSCIVTLPAVAKPSILALPHKLLYWWGSWQMNCVLHVMLTFEITLLSWYESWPPVFISCLLQIKCSYITLYNRNDIASTEVALMIVILTKIKYSL